MQVSVLSKEFPQCLGQKQSFVKGSGTHGCSCPCPRQTVCANVFDVTVGSTYWRLNCSLGVPEIPLENCNVNNFLTVNQCLLLMTVSFS